MICRAKCTPDILAWRRWYVWDGNDRLHEDMWLLVMKFLGPGALMRLALVNRSFHRLVMEKSVWKTACHRDLNVPYDTTPQFAWRHLYAAAVGNYQKYCVMHMRRSSSSWFPHLVLTYSFLRNIFSTIFESSWVDVLCGSLIILLFLFNPEFYRQIITAQLNVSSVALTSRTKFLVNIDNQPALLFRWKPRLQPSWFRPPYR